MSFNEPRPMAAALSVSPLERQVAAEEILESVTDAVFAIDRDWRFTYANAAAERLTRRPRCELVGGTVWELFPQAVGTEYERAYRAAMDGEQVVELDSFYVERLDTWTSLRVSPTRNGITACIRDVTAEKRAELAQLQQERRWRALIENASDPICVLSADGCVKYGSPAFRRLLGYEPHELANTDALSLVHPDDEPSARQLFVRVAGTPCASEQVELRYKRKDGQWTVLFVTVTNLLYDPSVAGIVCNSHDLTPRRELEEALRASERRLRAMFGASPVATFAWQRTGSDFTLIDFNDAAERITTGNVHDALGQRLGEFYADYPEIVRCVHDAPSDRGRPRREEIDYVAGPTGERRHVAMTFVAATPDLVLIHYEDLTEQRQVEALARGLSEQVITGIYLYQDDRFIYANPRLAEILGYSLEEIETRRGWKWFVHESSWPHVERMTERRLARAGDAVSYAYTAVRKDGTLIDLELHGTSMDYAGGRALLGTVLDISERRRAEDERLALANHVRLLLESTVEGLYGVDARGDITFVNGAGAAILGYSPSEIIGSNAHELVHYQYEDGRPYPKEDCPIRRVFEDGESIRIERDVFWHRDGSPMPVSYSASPVLVAGAITGAVVAFTDETRRRAAEAELHDREAHLAAIVSIQQEIATARLDLAPVMALVAERVRALTDAEGAAIELVEGDELVLHTAVGIAERYTGLRLSIATSFSGHCLRTGQPAICDDVETDPRVNRPIACRMGFRSMIVMPLHHDGAPIGVVKLLADEPNRFGEREARTLGLLGGLLGAAIGRAMDVQAKETLALERAAALEALSERESHFRSLIEHASDSILLFDAECHIVYASPAFSRLLGYENSTLYGTQAYALLHPEDVPTATETLGHLVATPDDVVTLDLRARHANGSYRTLACTGRNLLHHPAVGGIVVNLRDVTGQKHLEDELRQAQKMEAVGRLAGGIAHDFNNLLTIIKANTEFMLRRLAEGDAGREDALEIGRSADRAAALTRQLLAFSRRQVLQPRELDLNAVLSDTGRMIGRLIGDDIELVLDLHDDLGRVMADPGQMEQVVLNLAVNARDAMRGGGRLSLSTWNVDLTASREESDAVVPAGSYVVLCVSDNGQGMDRATMRQIFEPFFTTKAQGEGTGLGLSTVYGIVKQSDGFITVFSEPGHGTSFKIYLPRIAGTGVTRAIDAQTTSSGGVETLLLVEDSDPVRIVARRILESFGYTVLEASNGRDALELAASFDGCIDALVTDAVMPGISGRELAEALRPERPNVRVLYMSGYTDDIILRRGTLEPGSMFLEKPFSAKSLARAVRDVLSHARAT